MIALNSSKSISTNAPRELIQKTFPTWSTQRAPTSLAEADHYSLITDCKMLSLGERLPPPPQKKRKKKEDHYLHHDLGMLPLLWWVVFCFCFCSFTHFRIPRSPPNFNSSSLYYSGPLHKMSSQSVHNFLSNVVHRQTDKQTNQSYQRTWPPLARRW